MIRIRIHGRGGQGIKTASQILGTAGFFSGYQAQDFPLYGAERRGAPIVAFTRLAKESILERGAISRPDLLLIGDETLIDDPIAAPFAGADAATRIFINSTHDGEALKEHFKLPSLPVAVDVTEIGFRHLKKGNILSTALAAAGARMLGFIEQSKLRDAIKIELEQLGFRGEVVQSNLDLADETFDAISPSSFIERKDEPLSPADLATVEQDEVVAGAPLILNPGNMALRKTGNWRVNRPEIDYEHCNACWICFARCPDGAMGIGPDGKPVIDYDHCKGCLICAQECPSHAIKVIREVTSW